MARRVSLPAADDLFRPTSEAAADIPEVAQTQPTPVRAVPDRAERRAPAARPSGRVRHDEKMTVYVTSDELVAIEHARLALRSGHGLVVDRGRLIREAVAMVLAEFETQGEDSALVRRLTEE
ncbi:MAG: hypothetical protein F2667_01035 [Actinobacteria bacterium]|uniref:Unannotated protein n=1 Tax=freshwater metagenome TaxID=449393 RepID=A0A6J6NLK4_9ZZZZ|nr:hypothetical protein [Actinomycetota bacterium]